MKWYWRLVVVIFVLLGVWTLVPAPAGKPSLLGYYAHCSLTPVSTMICWIIAGACCWVGKKRATKKAL